MEGKHGLVQQFPIVDPEHCSRLLLSLLLSPSPTLPSLPPGSAGGVPPHQTPGGPGPGSRPPPPPHCGGNISNSNRESSSGGFLTSRFPQSGLVERQSQVESQNITSNAAF